MGLKMKYSHKNYNVCQFVLCSVRFYFSKKVKVVALQLFQNLLSSEYQLRKTGLKLKHGKQKFF